MSNTFDQLKKNRKNNFEKLAAELDKATGKVEYKNDDDRFWYPAVDKVGNGGALIRFLPAPKGEDVPFVRVFEHGFQGPTGSWYIEKSLTTLGRNDPVSEYNTKLWNEGKHDDSPERAQARKQKRKLNFISNIYVIEDPANPENKGKVFLFRYGKQVFDVLYEAGNPQVEGETKIDPFDLWEGANFRLKIRNKAGYRNYESSVFEAPGPLLKDEKKLQKIWESEYGLQEFVDPKNFKTYEELKAKLNRVLGLDEAPVVKASRTLEADTAPVERASKPVAEPELEAEDDEEIDFFRKLADEDEEVEVA